MFVKKGDVLAWDVSHVIYALHEHPVGWLLNKRALGLLTAKNHNQDVKILAWNAILDEFFCYSINSFQDVVINGFDVRRIESGIIEWFNLQQKARSELWSITRTLGYNYAGTMVDYARVGGMIYLYAQTN